MANNVTLGVLFVFIVGILVVIALLPQIAEEVEEMTNKQVQNNETINLSLVREPDQMDINSSIPFVVTEYPDSWKVANCPLESVALRNVTDEFTDSVDYNITESNGTVVIYNTTTTFWSDNDTYITYTYCMDGYIVGAGGRGVARTILIFSALGLLGFAVFMGIRQWIKP